MALTRSDSSEKTHLSPGQTAAIVGGLILLVLIGWGGQRYRNRIPAHQPVEMSQVVKGKEDINSEGPPDPTPVKAASTSSHEHQVNEESMANARQTAANADSE